jgi:hypothetical protein
MPPSLAVNDADVGADFGSPCTERTASRHAKVMSGRVRCLVLKHRSRALAEPLESIRQLRPALSLVRELTHEQRERLDVTSDP